MVRYILVGRLIGGGRDGGVVSAGEVVFVAFGAVLDAVDLSVGVERVLALGVGVLDVGFEEVGDLADVVAFEFLAVDGAVVLEVEVDEVLGVVVLVHADVLELELHLDVTVGQVG